MGLFESLPDKQLKRSQIDKLEKMDSVQGVFPVYDDMDSDTAHGLVILLNGNLRAWAYDGEWVELHQKEIENPVGGLPFDEQDTLEEFQNEIADRIGSTLV
ncbi:hypothetical protein [Natronorubrum sp. A-ect3]|uniref:hypothetical protein n=1 Tax=Natronorubrum sp. A-ect3 TaxID=3242698 RepID=UPI00359DC410